MKTIKLSSNNFFYLMLCSVVTFIVTLFLERQVAIIISFLFCAAAFVLSFPLTKGKKFLINFCIFLVLSLSFIAGFFISLNFISDIYTIYFSTCLLYIICLFLFCQITVGIKNNRLFFLLHLVIFSFVLGVYFIIPDTKRFEYGFQIICQIWLFFQLIINFMVGSSLYGSEGVANH